MKHLLFALALLIGAAALVEGQIKIGPSRTNTATLSTATLTVSGLTSTRVPFATTGGLITDDAGLTYSSSLDILTSTGGLAPGTQVFASLPASANGVILYCSDCTINSNPCTGAGTGAIAKRLNSAWACD